MEKNRREVRVRKKDWLGETVGVVEWVRERKIWLCVNTVREPILVGEINSGEMQKKLLTTSCLGCVPESPLVHHRRFFYNLNLFLRLRCSLGWEFGCHGRVPAAKGSPVKLNQGIMCTGMSGEQVYAVLDFPNCSILKFSFSWCPVQIYKNKHTRNQFVSWKEKKELRNRFTSLSLSFSLCSRHPVGKSCLGLKDGSGIFVAALLLWL